MEAAPALYLPAHRRYEHQLLQQVAQARSWEWVHEGLQRMVPEAAN